MTTLTDLLTLALKDIGALGIGQAISATDASDGMHTANMMLGQWQGERLSVYHLVDTAIQSTGAMSYTIGIGGAFNILRPIKINAAYARLNPGTATPIDYSVQMIDSREDYSKIGIKSLSSFPEWAYYDAAFPLGNLLFYPVPNNSFELHIVTMEALPQFTAPGAVVNLPPEYMAAIRYNLACYLAPSYQVPISRDLAVLAKNAKRVVKRMNAQIPSLSMPRGLGTTTKYNIYSDRPY